MGIELNEVSRLCDSDVQRFVEDHRDDDPFALTLHWDGPGGVSPAAVAEQIACRKKARHKLPAISQRAFLYQSEAVQMCSGEATAALKSTLMRGAKLADITGGLGIDTLFLSRSFEHTVYCECDPFLCELFRANLRLGAIEGVSIHQGDSIAMLGSLPDDSFDWIYADPSRRDSGRRYVPLHHCSPDVVRHEALLLRTAPRVCIKASPMLSAGEACRSLASLREIAVVSVGGECKEVLLFLRRADGRDHTVRIRAIVLGATGEIRCALAGRAATKPAGTDVSTVGAYWFDPDAAIRKAGLGAEAARRYGLRGVNPSFDFLTSDSVPQSFPGRSLEVVSVQPWKRGAVRQYLSSRRISSANITRRGFRHSVETLRGMLGLREGGEEYFFFTNGQGGTPIVAHCRRAVPARNGNQ